MRTFIALLILGLIVVGWNKHHHPRPSSANEASGAGGDGSLVVINFKDNRDLIAQLRQMKAGHVVSTHFVGSTALVSSGIQCSDTAAVAAYEAEMNRKLAEENRIIRVELKRIEGR